MKNAEYIVVNDGSEDNSLEIIEKLASEDNRITVISQKHNGISAAYNKAINIARGKYIYFTDENCLLKDNFMEEAFNKAESNSLEVLCFEENGDNKIISGDNLLMFYVHNELSPYVIGSKLFLKEFIQKNKIAFDERISRSNQIFVPLLTVNAKRTLVENNCYIAFNNSKESKKNNGYTADDFAEYFMIYTILSSKSIVSDYSETAKKAISEISRDIYYISNDIYMNLSNEQAKKVNEILPIEFKPLFFNTRELRNIKTSATYRVGDKLTNLPRKILNKSK